MLVAVAGPYSAPTHEERVANLDRMNCAAVDVLRKGHIPVIGVNAALPVVARLPEAERYDAIMDISLALVGQCDAILHIASSPGADRERDLVASLGRPVYRSITEIPDAPTGSQAAAAPADR